LRLLRVTAVLLIALAVSHAATGYTYSLIPQWDFQDSLFDDLSWQRTPGRISQDCTADGQSASEVSTNEASPEPVGSHALSYEEVQQIAQVNDWRVRKERLQNAVAVGWRGWIQDLARHGYYDNPDRRIVKLFLHDPFSDTKATSDQPPEAELYYFASADTAKLTVGQEVLVCGYIIDATPYYGATLVDIREPVVNPLPLPEGITSTHVPTDFSVVYEAHGCGSGYECPEYKLSIDGQGDVVYEGYNNVLITGTHTVSIPEDKVRQLAFELERAKFYSIDGPLERLPRYPEGSTLISATAGGRTKTIVFPWDSGIWPENVQMLIGKIEEVSGLRQWVKMVT
jgi:hypothetical protein